MVAFSRARSILAACAVSAWAVSATEDQAEIEALRADDQCEAGDESCALSALQLNKVKTTEASCEVTVEAQSKEYLHSWCDAVDKDARYPACYPLGVPAWKPADNVMAYLPDPAACPQAVSPEWTIAGWSWKYVQLAPKESYNISGLGDDVRPFLKLLRGTVLDVNENGILNKDNRWETFVVTPPITERDLQLSGSVKKITAGDEGAVFALMVVPVELLKTPITSMTEAPTTTISGPHSDLLKWTNYGEYYPVFEGWSFNNLAGIRLADHEGKHLCYNQWWTAREDMNTDGGYHNQHDGGFANSTFGELHMMMYPANPNAGLIVQLPHTINTETIPDPKEIGGKTAERPQGDAYFYNQRDNKYVQLTIPMPPGYVHGPLWSINKKNGEPTFDCHGAVRYPWHGLVTGPVNAKDGYTEPLRYNLWVAFEHPVKDITVPTAMLQYVQNAYLEYDVDWKPVSCGGPEHGAGA